MQLWTIQSFEWYEKMLQDGVMYGDKAYVDKGFIQPYQWLMKKMDEKIGERPFFQCHPIWAWYQYSHSKKQKPDLRNTALLPKGMKGVRVAIQKKKDDVLLSDFDLWHAVLNYWEISDNEEEYEESDRLLQSNGVAFTDIENDTPEIKQRVEKSWNKIFDMGYATEYMAESFENKSIQATFWKLSIEEIMKVEEFIAR